MMHFDINRDDFWLDKGELRSSPYCYICHTAGCRTAHRTEAQILEGQKETHNRRLQEHMRVGMTMEAAKAYEDRYNDVYFRLQIGRQDQ